MGYAALQSPAPSPLPLNLGMLPKAGQEAGTYRRETQGEKVTKQQQAVQQQILAGLAANPKTAHIAQAMQAGAKPSVADFQDPDVEAQRKADADAAARKGKLEDFMTQEDIRKANRKDVAQFEAGLRPPAQGPKPDYITLTDPNGVVQDVPRGPDANAKLAAGWKLHESQQARRPIGAERVALGFYNRAQDADQITKKLEGDIAKSNIVRQGQLQYAPNMLQTESQQAYRQAQRTFTEARLRKESGAAIPAKEYETDAKTYFAQPGDSAATLLQKQKARQDVLDGLGFAAGPAYEEFYGEPFKKGQPPKPGGVEDRMGTMNQGVTPKTLTRAAIASSWKAKGFASPQAAEADATSRGYTIVD
jgi:hypothetical protein